MVDFMMISTRSTRRGDLEIFPKFILKKSNDLMIRGRDFYAIWIEEMGIWSIEEDDVIRLIDNELRAFAKEKEKEFTGNINVLYMWDSDSGVIDSWHRYCQKQMRDNFHALDEKLVFSNTPVNKLDYSSKRLEYPLISGTTDAFDKLINTLYLEDERDKLMWAIGAIVSGDSKKIQKFLVLYGSAGTGKSTILNIIEMLFKGYISVFDARALGSSSNSFALESFRTNPLVGIQHDGDLSRIEDNTRLNSLVSHETMSINEKFKPTYAGSFKCFLFMGTNKPVKITDAKSGLLRRLIDVTPSGNKLPVQEYNETMNNVKFELGAIANKCLEFYSEYPGRYDGYIPVNMMDASNDFYNFVYDNYNVFERDDCTTLKASWEMYASYCDEARVPYPLSKRLFKEELKNYFSDYKERITLPDGTRARNYYTGFLTNKFVTESKKKESKTKQNNLISFNSNVSLLDDLCSNCVAQYANDNGTPIVKWDEVKSILKSLDSRKLHYVKLPIEHIVIDFDLVDEEGNKSFELNLKEASKWPQTYAELSKSGNGIHLHYIYDGNPELLDRIFAEHIEVKVFKGNSSLRRKVTKCNDIPVAHISSGLPLKGETKMVSANKIESEKGLRAVIQRAINKEIHSSTKPNIDFIYKVLEDAYNSDLTYDVSNMRNSVLAFAASSTNQADYCMKLVNKMEFKSEEECTGEDFKDDAPIVFYDVEVFPNLFLVNWKVQGENKPVVRMINPKPRAIEELLGFKLVGFNNRKYDNHMLYGCLMGYDNTQLYRLSQRIIGGDKNAFFGEAYNLSYTDIYDFAATKKSLKKWEIELGLHHLELGLPWDEEVPESKWEMVAKYCDNDVIATEAVFNHLEGDFVGRKILAEISGGSVNDTTNTLTKKLIFGNERNPQTEFNYRDMSDDSDSAIALFDDEFALFDSKNRPIFKGYEFDKFKNKSTYRGFEVGEGGFVWAKPGMYGFTKVFDVTSMHPHSVMAENLFGDAYTEIFKSLVNTRVAIKNENFEAAYKMFDGKLKPYLTDEKQAKRLSYALKIAINSVYGLTAAAFDNPFRDPRNIDNIVAKRGALFMINLMKYVQSLGYEVIHVKTDSIKVVGADDLIEERINDYGKMYGYGFEVEDIFEKICLVNDAVYIGYHADTKEWSATGKEFAVPYVFKTLFTKEPIKFEDLCEAKQANRSIFLDLNEKLPDVSEYESVMEIRKNPDKKYTNKALAIAKDYDGISDDDLQSAIDKGHKLHFVGKVGNFVPVKEGIDGGVLLVENGKGGYNNVQGCKGMRWMEAVMVKERFQDCVNMQYHKDKANKAFEHIAEFGDAEWFCAEQLEEEELPFV